MNKNIIVISGSPRQGGNSDVLCDTFIRGARDAGHTAEKIFLRSKKIGYCLACEACVKTKRCVQQDDMEIILSKMVAADVIVLATPVYFYTMDAQIKTLIDRTVPRYMDITDKEMYFIVTAADGNEQALERTVDGFRGFTDCLRNIREKGVLYAAGVWKKGDILRSPAVDRAYEMGKNA